MLQPRCLMLGAASSSSSRLLPSTAYTSLTQSLSRLSLSPALPIFPSSHNHNQVRHAGHNTQGRANRAAQGPGKRLGAKRASSELVVPGCILFRQRGAKWWPGENCSMGRDHTISALAKGYVRYYLDPERHPKRKFIGVVFDQSEQLPRSRNMSRRRRLGLEPREMSPEEMAGGGKQEIVYEKGMDKMAFKSGYQYRPSNTQIGRAAKESDRKYPVYKPHDRWLAWRLRHARIEIAKERRALRMRTSAKTKGKRKQKGGQRRPAAAKPVTA